MHHSLKQSLCLLGTRSELHHIEQERGEQPWFTRRSRSYRQLVLQSRPSGTDPRRISDRVNKAEESSPDRISRCTSSVGKSVPPAHLISFCVSGDINGDGVVDFEIQIVGIVQLASSDPVVSCPDRDSSSLSRPASLAGRPAIDIHERERRAGVLAQGRHGHPKRIMSAALLCGCIPTATMRGFERGRYPQDHRNRAAAER